MVAVTSYLKRLSSVTTVHFTEDAVVDWVLHSTKKYVLDSFAEHKLGYTFMGLIVRANLRPSLIRTKDVSIHLLRRPDQTVSKMNVNGTAPASDLGLPHQRKLMDLDEGVPMRQGPHIFMDLHYFGQFVPIQCFMENIWLFTAGEATYHLRQFFGNPRLTSLSLRNVLLCPYTNHGDVFEELMLVLRDRAQDSSCPALNVSMDTIFKVGHSGHVSFTNEEFSRWIEEPGNTWLRDQQDSFTVESDSDDWETDSEVSDNEASNSLHDTDEARAPYGNVRLNRLQELNRHARLNRLHDTEEAHAPYRHARLNGLHDTDEAHAPYRHARLIDFISSDSDVDSIFGDSDRLSNSDSDDNIGFGDVSDLSDSDSLQRRRRGLIKAARLKCFERSNGVRTRQTNRLRGSK